MRRPRWSLFVGAFVVLAGCSSTVAVPEAAPTTTAVPNTSTPAVSVVPLEPDEPPIEALRSLPGRIVVLSPAGDLVVSAADGTNLQVLDRAGTAVVSQPTWSTDAARMSWTEFGAEGSAVRVHDFANGNTDSYPTVTPRFYHAWNAEGTALATLGSSASGPIQLDVIDVTTGLGQEVATGQPFYLDWEHTGSGAVISVNGAAVGRVNIAEGNGRDIPLSGPLGAFQSPSVLADGSFLIALASSVDAASLVRVSPDGIETVLATFVGAIAMATSPDSSSVAVLVSADPSEPQLEQASFQTLPELRSGRVSLVDLTTGEVSTLPHRDVVTVNWSPDGTWLASLQRTGSDARWIYDSEDTSIVGPAYRPTDTMLREYLPFADQYNQSHTWWSPDGTAFLLSGTLNATPGIWVDVVADDLLPSRVADGAIAFWSPR